MSVIYKATYRLVCGRPIHKTENELEKNTKNDKTESYTV